MTIRAAAPGVLPGTDYQLWTARLAAELNPPHPAPLVELPARGHHATALGRGVAQLTELYAELTSYGWRLVQRPGADDHRATRLLAADVDTLADVHGERAESSGEPPGPLRVEVLGPISLAAQLHLPSGEKALIDHGARRDLADSLADGLRRHMSHLRRAVPGGIIDITVLEPDYSRVLQGEVPTASGYRRIRSLEREELRDLLGRVLRSLSQSAADTVTLDFGSPVSAEQVEDFQSSGSASVDGFAFPTRAASTGDWERAAELAEEGAQLHASLLHPREAAGDDAVLPQVRELAARIAEPWRRLGMPAHSLEAFTVTAYGAEHRTHMTHLSDDSALGAMNRLLGAANALTDLSLQ